MAYLPDENGLNFDVFPLVMAVGQPTTVTVRPLGEQEDFVPGKTYTLEISGLNCGRACDFPTTACNHKMPATYDAQNGFVFTHTFPMEQEYYLIFLDKDGKRIKSFHVYAVEGELTKRYPFIGDLHLHSTRSDGNEVPEVVCANYRRYGYDFLAITDHHRYYPSLEAIDAYKDCPIELNIVPGEEVHMPDVNGKSNDIHIINFGGEYSINAMVEDDAIAEKGKDLKFRATRTENVPDVMTQEEFAEKMEAHAATFDLPENVERMPYAMCCWIFDEIRKANGLAIFAHPNWRRDRAFHVPEVFTDYMMAQQPFDAFEVLGGESYYEQNGFQVLRYYEERAKGHIFPIVGSTDSHKSTRFNRDGFIGATMVFSPENECKALIGSIKDMYSVAIDTISKEFRLVGESRLARYACFLLQYYFPRHDELCYEEGRMMKQYVTGTQEEKAEALAMLHFIHGRVEKQRKKYFGF